MTRTVAHSNLATPASRARLKPREKPFWQAIDPGTHIGYRRAAVGGKWCVRIYQGGGKYQLTSFAIADDHVEADGTRVMNFAQARRHALTMAAAPPVGPLTVSEAMSAYFDRLKQKGRSPSFDERRSALHILPALGSAPVDSLTTLQLDTWLASLVRASTPDKVRASRASANRVLTILKAGLNMAFKADKCASAKAWSACQPFEDTNRPRLRFFSRDEVMRLLNATSGTAFGDLCRSALHTGCRYGELMRLKVGDWSPDGGTVFIAESKSGKPRFVHVTDEGARFFTGLVAGRARDAFMLVHADSRPWLDTQQSSLMTRAMQGRASREGLISLLAQNRGKLVADVWRPPQRRLAKFRSRQFGAHRIDVQPFERVFQKQRDAQGS